jgi:transposase
MHKPTSEFAAVIGIDWADKKHDVCLHVPGSEGFEQSVLEHRVAAIETWALGLRERFGGAPIAVCVELAQGPIVSALLEYDFFVLFPINPATLARYRRAFTPSRAKDDPTDARIAVELFQRHRDKLSALERESDGMRALRRLVQVRRDLVQDRVRVTNRLTHALKAYFPQVLSWFRDKWTDVFVEFVTRWPTLLTAQRARRETLVAFFHEHNVRRAATVERRLEAIKTEKPLTTDRAVIEPAVLHVQALLAQLRELNRSHTSTRKSHNAAPSWLISNSSQLCLVPDPVWPRQGVS